MRLFCNAFKVSDPLKRFFKISNHFLMDSKEEGKIMDTTLFY